MTIKFLLGADPFAAVLGYADQLSPEEREYCVQFCAYIEPLMAIVHLNHFLSDDQFDFCARHFPMEANQYHPARMTQEQISHSLMTCPWAVLKYNAHRLTNDQINFCARHWPIRTLEFASHRLTPKQIVTISRKFTVQVIEILNGQPEEALTRRLFNLAHRLNKSLFPAVMKAMSQICGDPQPSRAYPLHRKVLEYLGFS